MVDRRAGFNRKMVMVMSDTANDQETGNGAVQGPGQVDITAMLGRALAKEAVAQGEDCARDAAGNLACPAVEKTFRWLLEQGSSTQDMPQFLLGLVKSLSESGFPLLRLNVGQRTLHPQIAAIGYIWSRGDTDITTITRDFSVISSAAYTKSPIRQLYEFGIKRIRRRLEGPDAQMDFPILTEMRDLGATDYAIFALNFGAIVRSSMSITTDQPGGFSDTQLAAFEAIVPIMAMIVEKLETRRLAGALLEVYLGKDPGRRVLAGAIQRGEGVTIAAAVWYCDLRDFTRLSNKMPRDEVIALLNDYFDAVARPVHANGGEILKFIGDAVLAIFPMLDDLDRDQQCRVALTAAMEALEAISELNELRASAGKKPLKIGIGLHAGSVTYGNIGVVSHDLARLDFTVIGPAVNLAARIGDLCRPLDEVLLASRAFASPCGSTLVPLGKYDLRGFDQPEEVFGLPR
jgi:adenylate cyclase